MYLFFYKLLFEVKKIDVRLNKTLKLKFILMFFESVHPKRPSDTVNNYTNYPMSYWWKDYSNGLGSYFATLSYGYFIDFVSKNDSFLSRPSDTKIRTAVIWW